MTTQHPPAGTVAEPPAAPYTGSMHGERAAASVPWWRDAVRSWAPVLGLAALLVFQMVGLQQQIGDLRADLLGEIGDLRGEIGDVRGEIRTEIGKLRVDHQKEIGHLRIEIDNLRDDIRTEIGNLRVDLGERITRLETLMETRSGTSSSGR